MSPAPASSPIASHPYIVNRWDVRTIIDNSPSECLTTALDMPSSAGEPTSFVKLSFEDFLTRTRAGRWSSSDMDSVYKQLEISSMVVASPLVPSRSCTP